MCDSYCFKCRIQGLYQTKTIRLFYLKNNSSSHDLYIFKIKQSQKYVCIFSLGIYFISTITLESKIWNLPPCFVKMLLLLFVVMNSDSCCNDTLQDFFLCFCLILCQYMYDTCVVYVNAPQMHTSKTKRHSDVAHVPRKGPVVKWLPLVDVVRKCRFSCLIQIRLDGWFYISYFFFLEGGGAGFYSLLFWVS